jgi:protein SCO1
MNAPTSLSVHKITHRWILGLLVCLAFISWSQATVLPQWIKTPIFIPDVVLVDSEGIEHRLQTLVAERPVAVSFFFTHCTTACPVQTVLFRQAQDMLLRQRSNGLLLLISVDPSNDTPDALRTYAAKFKAELGLKRNWLMLTGDGNALAKVWTVFDNDSNRPKEHLSAFWIGSAKRQHWSRLIGLPIAAQLVEWMEASNL